MQSSQSIVKMSTPISKSWASLAAAGGNTVALAPVRLADIKAVTAKASVAYIPPSKREASAALQTSINIDDSRAFPDMAAPGRPTPISKEDLKVSTSNFKQTILDRISKDEESILQAAAAAAAAAVEKDPLEMTDTELVSSGWEILKKRGRTAEDAEYYNTIFKDDLVPVEGDEYSDERSAIYDSQIKALSLGFTRGWKLLTASKKQVIPECDQILLPLKMDLSQADLFAKFAARARAIRLLA